MMKIIKINKLKKKRLQSQELTLSYQKFMEEQGYEVIIDMA